MSGPLAGMRFVEMAGIGPVPFAAMVLADLGAEGIRIESPRPGLMLGDPMRDITRRGRTGVVVDVRQEAGRDLVLDLVAESHVLIEGFRPGVMERLGLSPEVCLARRPSLVYGRMTGWGQDGPWARTAGHDLDYIAVAGVLAHIGRRDQPPTPPLNLVGDYGGGAMLLLVGVLAALWHAERTGEGQAVDAAMVDGAVLLMSLFHSMSAIGMWREEAGVNLLDSGTPFYDAYRTSDGKWIAIGCLEPQFYAEWLRLAGLDGEDLPAQFDIAGWPVLRERFAHAVATRTRDDWAALADGTDACVAPVLSMSEAPQHPHLAARGTFAEVDGIMQAAPAPRFSRTPADAPGSVQASDRRALLAWGVDDARISALAAAGILPD
ncbi:MAG: CoA transferase [Candidatus Nanopelagicales bacterium]|nr:CoA transferase [Candidatus Nanopelagicales bacterium]MDP4715996.1 CoA transferase [Candidatus Nanopelagicales bacterium]MDP4905979.1 CoA transferase [Candidatus Nanopelagicales bacterium]MDP5095100.1 CoA transferase [Candidatus Nanopelagicales bacterium]